MECSQYLGCVASNDARRTRVIKTRTRYDTLSLLPLEGMSDIGVGTKGQIPGVLPENKRSQKMG
jgi:hypothetical protein